MPFNFDKKIRNIQASQKIPKLVGNDILTYFKKQFDSESWEGNPWKARKRMTKQDKATGRRRSLLVQSGSLRKSLRAGAKTWKKIEVGSYGISYAGYHNNGEEPQEKRQFVGKSKKLDKIIQKRVSKELKKLMT